MGSGRRHGPACPPESRGFPVSRTPESEEPASLSPAQEDDVGVRGRAGLRRSDPDPRVRSGEERRPGEEGPGLLYPTVNPYRVPGQIILDRDRERRLTRVSERGGRDSPWSAK